MEHDQTIKTKQKKRSDKMAKRFARWGVVINPPKNDKNWIEMTPEQIANGLQELNFIKAPELHAVLKAISIRGQKKKKQNNTDDTEFYSSTVKSYVGQLEQGEGGTVHWQLAIELTSGVTKIRVLEALSNAIYKTNKSEAISVKYDSNKSELIEYCQKDARLEVPAPYDVNILDKKLFDYYDYLEENPEVGKFLKLQEHSKDTSNN